MKKALLRLYKDESAVTAMEYALMASLIAVVIIVSVGSVGASLGALYDYVKDKVVLAVQ